MNIWRICICARVYLAGMVCMLCFAALSSILCYARENQFRFCFPLTFHSLCVFVARFNFFLLSQRLSVLFSFGVFSLGFRKCSLFFVPVLCQLQFAITFTQCSGRLIATSTRVIIALFPAQFIGTWLVEPKANFDVWFSTFECLTWD